MTLHSPLKIQFLNMFKKYFNWKSAVALFVAVLIAASASFMFFQESDEEKILNLSDEEKILNLVSDLGESMSEGDFEGLLDCFDPKTRVQMKSLMSIGSAIGGVDLEDLWSLGSIQMAGDSSDLKIIFTVHDIDFSDESNAEVEISANVDVQPAMHVKVKVVKINGKWYFSDNNIFF